MRQFIIAAVHGRHDEGLCTTACDLDELAGQSASWDLVRDRRPDLYGALTNPG